jgi:hypothetical protein
VLPERELKPAGLTVLRGAVENRARRRTYNEPAAATNERRSRLRSNPRTANHARTVLPQHFRGFYRNAVRPRRGSVSTSVRGQCLCGAIAFSIAPPYRWFAHCHCSLCRKHHGTLFGTGLGVARAAFQWLAGADTIVHYRASAAFERPFCGRCGSTAPAPSHDERFWHVPAGLLDGDPVARPRSHIFFASRSPLTEIGDALPKHAAYPPGIELPIVAAPGAADPDSPLTGSCLCGAVAFASTELPLRLTSCHCSLCRLSRAAAFASTLRVPHDAFRWLRGSERVRRYALPGPRRYATCFCEVCGGKVPSAPADSAATLPAGAIDTPLPRLPAAHFYVGSKAAWYDITDAWPQFAELPPPERLKELLR